jgi:hypothetical protein
MCEKQFISGDDVTESDLDAAERGELVVWRRGPDGVQWFKRTAMAAAERPEYPEIHGVAEEAGLDDFERALLQQWADDLRQAAADRDDTDATDE